MGEDRMTDVAVLVPGMMGSALNYRRKSGDLEVWGPVLHRNYHRMLTDPALLQWGGTPAIGSFIHAYAPTVGPWPRLVIWKRVEEVLAGHVDFGAPLGILRFGYDWRQSLIDTAPDLRDSLDAHDERLVTLGSIQGAGSSPNDGSPATYTFITHSMGALLVRVALGLGLIDVTRVRRLIHICAPLQGAASSFGALYRDARLPYLREMAGWLYRRKNGERFFEMLLGCIQTFPSLYQLLPPPSLKFIFEAPGTHASPFEPLYASQIPREHRDAAALAWAAASAGADVIRASGTPCFTIYGDHHRSRMTALSYRIVRNGSGIGFTILEEHETAYGDGTVVRESATDGRGFPLANATHGFMPNDRRVGEIVGMLT